MSKEGKPKADDRADRLAAALKENLRRRKAQVRSRRDAHKNDAEPGDGEMAERSPSVNAETTQPDSDGEV